MEGLAASLHLILNVSRILALPHPDSLFEECFTERNLPNRHRAFEPEILDVHVPMGFDGSAAPAIRRERVRRPNVLDDFVDLGNKLCPAHWWIQGGDEESMITPRQIPADRSCSETPNPVRDQPFPPFGNRQIVAHLPSKRDGWFRRIACPFQN